MHSARIWIRDLFIAPATKNKHQKNCGVKKILHLPPETYNVISNSVRLPQASCFFSARDGATGVSFDTWSIFASGISDPVLWSHETRIWGWKLFQILGHEAPLFAAIDKESSSGHWEDVESSSEGWFFSILFLKSKGKITSALHCFPRNNHKYTYSNQVAK